MNDNIILLDISIILIKQINVQVAQAPHHDHHSIVEEHYDAIHRQVDQQLEGAAQVIANRALSPQRPYPIRPKNRVIKLETEGYNNN